MKMHSVALAMMALVAAPMVVSFTASPAFAGSTQVRPAPGPELFGAAPATTITRADYKIGRQDMLVVDVFQIADLSRTVQVDSNGNILLPLIGQIAAIDRTTDQLSADISSALAKTYVKDPKVAVTIKESSSQKVTIDGAVQQPGLYAIQSDTTLLKAIAMAHGPDMKLANVNKVAIFRNAAGQRTTAVFDLEDIRDGKAADPQVFADDVIVVDTSGTRRFLQDIGMVAPWATIFTAF